MNINEEKLNYTFNCLNRENISSKEKRSMLNELYRYYSQVKSFAQDYDNPEKFKSYEKYNAKVRISILDKINNPHAKLNLMLGCGHSDILSPFSKKRSDHKHDGWITFDFDQHNDRDTDIKGDILKTM